MRIDLHGVALDLPGSVILDARARLLAASDPTTAQEIGLCLLVLGLDKLRPYGQQFHLTAGGLGRVMAGLALDYLGAHFPDVMATATSASTAVLALHPYVAPAPVQEAPKRPERHWSNIPDPYPGLVLDTGRGPECWLDFSARSNGGRAEGFEAQNARWLAAIAEWERSQGGG